jgi:hypothetical protein
MGVSIGCVIWLPADRIMRVRVEAPGNAMVAIPANIGIAFAVFSIV